MPDFTEVAMLVLGAAVLCVPVIALIRFLFFPQKRKLSRFTLLFLTLAFLGVGAYSYIEERGGSSGGVDFHIANPMHGIVEAPAIQGEKTTPILDRLESIMYFAITLFAATVAYLFSVNSKLKSSVPALKRLIPSRSDAFYDRIDFIVMTFGGAVIGFVFFDPTTARQALSAGLGWVGAVNILSHGSSTS